MARNRNISEIVWPENRDEIFLKWIAEDAASLHDAGFSVADTRSMLAALKYVRIWCANPPWLFPVKGLPKGYRWQKGQRFSSRRVRKSAGYSYTFLPIGEDLYIKGMIVVGIRPDDYSAAKIRRYRELTCAEISSGLSLSPELSSAIHTFWKSQGLPLGYAVPCLRPFRPESRSRL